MFERFTDRARRVLVLAQDEARAMEHNFLGTEHVLLGMLAEGEGVAAKALTELGTDLDGMRSRIREAIPPGAPGTASGAPPFTPRAKHVLELALREALEMSHNYIGTEHLLLGLIREGEGVAAQVLKAAGLDAIAVRSKVLSLLAGYQATSNPFGRTTPAGGQLATRARSIAGTDPVGSHHFLLGILEDPGSLGSRVLGSFGVTREAVTARIKEIGAAGTTDEVRDRKSDKPFTFDFGGVTLQVESEELAMKLALALKQGQEQGAAAAVAEDVGSLVADALRRQSPETGAGEAEEPPGEDAASSGAE